MKEEEFSLLFKPYTFESLAQTLGLLAMTSRAEIAQRAGGD
jgi:hypothetical protein